MKSIIQKYFEGRASEAEQEELLKWLREEQNLSLFRKYKFEWKAGLSTKGIQSEHMESWDRIQARLVQKSFDGWQRSSRFQSFFKYAAIFFFLLATGTIYFLFPEKPEKNTEYCTTVVADNGQISKIILPDSSLVWLNSGTTLSYNNRYALDNRNIKLNGEAWFQTSRNEALPMVINCSGLFVKVMGTSFNVSAYPGYSKIDVVLGKGSVELYENMSNAPVLRLKPGEMAEFSRQNRTIAVNSVNTVKYSSWKEGMINFYNLRLEEVVLRLEKRYNQQFFVDEQIKAIPLTFTIKNESLEAVLNLMSRIAPVSAIQEKDQIHLRYGKRKALNMEKKKMN